MAETVVMPQAGNSVESCIVLSWRVAAGDVVAVGDVLCEIETDKATMEVESTAAGTVLRLEAGEGDEVAVQAPLLIVGAPGESISENVDTSGTTPSGDGKNGASNDNASVTPDPGTSSTPDINTVADTSRKIVRSFSTGEVRVSPRARKRAQTLGIDPTTLEGSGPGGRVIDRDVLAVAEAGGATAGDGAGQNAPRSTAAATGDAPYTEVAVTGIRRTIATRMLASLQESAQLTLFRKADARALLAYRQRVKAELARPGADPAAGSVANVTINDMVVFAVSRVLPDFPDLNAHFMGDKIRQFGRVDLGFAVDTPKGLLVPTVAGANGKSLNAIARESRELAERAVAGRATPDDLGSATFTITNLGGLGIESFTPVLNTPQVGILGVGSIVPGYVYDEDGPVATASGTTAVIPQIGLSLTIDHRAVDGAPGARFLQELAHRIATFELTLAQ